MLTGTFNAAEVFLFLFFLHLSPDLYLHTILSQQFISTINYGTLYRRCVLFKNNVQSTEFTTDGLQSCCRNI